MSLNHSTVSVLFSAYDPDDVFRAVIKCGQDKWYSIGLALGFTAAETRTHADAKPALSSKLQAIIDAKIAWVGETVAAKALLEACRNIVNPCIEDVERELEEMAT